MFHFSIIHIILHGDANNKMLYHQYQYIIILVYYDIIIMVDDNIINYKN